AGLGGWDDGRGGVLCGDASAGGDPGRTEPRDLARGVCAVAWSGEEVRMKLALCLEYPISQFGGTEVLVSELIRGLKNRHEIVLVSPDKPSAPDLSSLGKLSGHVMWQPGSVSQKQSRELAANLAQQRVSLAHFHFGGNYGWGNRYWPLCPIMYLSSLGVPCMSTNHGAFSIMDGYCGSQRS